MSAKPRLVKSEGGWELNVRQRARVVRGRTMIQPPTEEDAKIVRANALARPVNGIPVDVLMTLQALRDLADQGNLAAKWLYEEESRKFGLTSPIVHLA